MAKKKSVKAASSSSKKVARVERTRSSNKPRGISPTDASTQSPRKKRIQPTASLSASNSQSAAKVIAILDELRSMGNEKVRQMYIKNGAKGETFGVKLGDLRTIANKHKKDHELGLELWKLDVTDAKLLAALLLNPSRLTLDQLDEMVQRIEFVQVADWFHSYVTKEFSEKEVLRVRWMDEKNAVPMTARAGWRLTAGRVVKSPEGLDLEALLDRIDSELSKAPQFVQWTMNSCLAEIGIHFPKLRKRAIAIGQRHKLYEDYPVSKGCTSPYAPIWISEMVKRNS